jgi:hypothetical protein
MQKTLCGAAAFVLLTGLSVALQAQRGSTDWTQWRGPNRDGVATNFSAPASWPDTLSKSGNFKWAPATPAPSSAIGSTSSPAASDHEGNDQPLSPRISRRNIGRKALRAPRPLR